MLMLDPEFSRCGVVRSQIIRDHVIRYEAIFLQQLPHQFQRGGFIPLSLDQDIQNLSFAIDGSPQIDQTSIDLQIDFVEMPSRIGRGPASTQVRSDHRTEMVHLAPNGFVGDRDAAFRQQILDVAKA